MYSNGVTPTYSVSGSSASSQAYWTSGSPQPPEPYAFHQSPGPGLGAALHGDSAPYSQYSAAPWPMAEDGYDGGKMVLQL